MAAADFSWTLAQARNDDGAKVGTVLHIGGDFGGAWCGQWLGYSPMGRKVGASELDYAADHSGQRFNGMTVCKRCLRSWKAM